jgi:soluble epoxide hydrolase / lipid-phosphate phosphatase
MFNLHSRGSMITRRIVQLYSDRVIAAGFLVIGYGAPDPNFNYEAILAVTKERLGFEMIGYWEFFGSEGADKIIEENVNIRRASFLLAEKNPD